jgi:hypothetical protein
MSNVITALVLAAALAAGVYLTGVDARTDDTGVLAGAIGLTAGVLSAIRPRAAVIVGALVGLPIPVVNAARFENWLPSVAALGFALAGAFAGAYVGIIVRRTVQRASG